MNYRHGDIALIKVDKLPDGLKKSDSKILIQSSGGNPHSFDNGEFYPSAENNFVFGYLVARDTTLYHAEHGLKIKGQGLRITKIENDVYQLRRQNEDTNTGMKPVID